MNKSASETVIKEKYNRLLLENHPDKVEKEAIEAATEKFRLLQSVFKILMDKHQRKIYDESGIINDNIASKMEPIYISDTQLKACMEEFASELISIRMF